MARKRPRQFIPEADHDFARMAGSFARMIARKREKYFISAEDSDLIMRRAEEFRQALFITRAPSGRTKATSYAKAQARARAEQIIRKWGNFIRAHPHISEGDKALVYITPRPARLKQRKCPQSVPVLRFMGTVDGVYSAMPIHVLAFWEYDPTNIKNPLSTRRSKPPGAARVELFVELIDPDEPVPNHPSELGRPWFLRSFTKNPMRVEFPMPLRPMKVVYWARWADAKGDFGPFSKTCVARVEGWHDAGLLEDKRSTGQRVVVSLRRRELPTVERPTQRPLLECDATVADEPKALPDAA